MSTSLAHPPSAKPPVHSGKCIIFQEQIEIPLGIDSLQDFREWARSDAFPQEGRIDYIDGCIEVDLMVENLFYHGSPKSEIARVISNRVYVDRSGRFFIDTTRISSVRADVSAEPDLLFLSFDTIRKGRVQLIPAQSGDPDSFIEIEGAPDWVCEIVRDSSETKDTVRLAQKYFEAGVLEYWLVDARGESLAFTILQRGPQSLVAVAADADGYQASTVFQQRYQFSRERGPDGHWDYRLDERPLV